MNEIDITSTAPVFRDAISRYPTNRAFSGDAGYQGLTEEFAGEQSKLVLHIAQKPLAPKGRFIMIPKRWMVGQTFVWLGHFRRFTKDFKILTNAVENMIRIAMLRLAVANCLKINMALCKTAS